MSQRSALTWRSALSAPPSAPVRRSALIWRSAIAQPSAIRHRRPQQQAFHGAAGGTAGVEAGGDDGSIVAEEGVGGLQVVAQVAELAVFDPVGVAVDDEQTGVIAPAGGGLGDEPVGQGVVEEVGLHAVA